MIDTFAAIRLDADTFIEVATGVYERTVKVHEIEGSPLALDARRPWHLTAVCSQGAVAVELYAGKDASPFLTGPAETSRIRIPMPTNDVRYRIELPSGSSTLRPTFLHLERAALPDCEC